MQRAKPLRAVMLGTLVCYGFITLSGTMHYNPLLATFVALGAALLRREQLTTPLAEFSGGRL